jgi:predicted metal-dependent peptidase
MNKLTKARARLVLKHPFFASILLSLDLIEVPDLNPPTMATNGKAIFFHPSVLDKWSVDEVMGVLAHEVMHVAMLHPWRRGHRKPTKANHAMDYAINGIIEGAGMTLPKGRLRSPTYDGKSFEEIYTMLPDQEDGGNKKPGDGSGEGEPDDQFDNVMDAPGNEAERQQSEAEAKIKIQQAANHAKAQGKLPGALADLVAEALAPKVDWRAELRRYMTSISKADQSWQRGQRRFLAQGLYLPAFHTPAMGRVVVGIDTSGSIVGRVGEFLDEVRAICDECKPSRLTVIQCDAKVTDITDYAEGEPIQCHVKGGGGTDLRAIYPAIDDEAPAVMVLLSDGLTPWLDAAPDFPHITVTTDEFCPYGDNIKMD